MPRTYTNPVYRADFPDPFVLRHRGRYYAYGTGRSADGRRLPMLSSADLVSWEPHGGAIEPLDLPGAEEYWAPEVAYSEGLFYLYYAVGRGEDPDHHLRVAVSEHPLGPWRDRGLNLTPSEIFAIDAHPFRDAADGQWYLFYARDELESPFAGTGVVVDRLVTMDRLAGEPRPVLRPFADWQVFELQRAVKKGLDWYTIEGPFTLRVGDRTVCFYSGGRWENPNYGVGYALAGHPLGPWEDAANRSGPQVLRTAPGKVLGPGHNCVVAGPDLVSQYIVYHGWDPDCTARYPRIDLLEWEDGLPRCDGPSWEPRPAPRPPDLLECFDSGEPGPAWNRSSGWTRTVGGIAAAEPGARLGLQAPVADFAAEGSFRAPAGGEAVVEVGALPVHVGRGSLRVLDRSVPLPPAFRPGAWHHLHLRRDSGRLTATLDEYPTVQVAGPAGPTPVALGGTPGTEFGHFALTRLGS